MAGWKPAWRKSRTPSIAERTYTLMLVPEGGRGAVRQVTLTLRQARNALMAGTIIVLLALAGLGWVFVGVPRQVAYAELAEENLALKERLQRIESTVAELEAALGRLRMYEAQLRGIEPDKLPLNGAEGDGSGSGAGSGSGYGPLESDEVAIQEIKSAWSVLDLVGASTNFPEEDAPMDEIEEGAPPRYMESSFKELDTVQVRAERVGQVVQMLEPQLALLVESAADYRLMVEAFPSINPCPDGVLTSGFGYRRSPFTRRWKFHTGLDLAGPVGTPIIAPAPGTVILADWNSGYGRSVEIDHGYGLVSRFAHTSKVFVKQGDAVTKGQVIANIGLTGQTTGPHLHYEVMVNGERVDPMFYIPRSELPHPP